VTGDPAANHAVDLPDGNPISDISCKFLTAMKHNSVKIVLKTLNKLNHNRIPGDPATLK
jgi:hypothetical protein